MTNPNSSAPSASDQSTQPVHPNSPQATTYGALSVRVYTDPAALAQDAARQAAVHLEEALSRQDTASVILATGQSQLLLLDILFANRRIDWGRVQFFHMDEYLGLPKDHPSSFRHYLHERVERRIRSRAFHYLEGDASEPARECDRYAALLRAGPIDLCFLGVGNNGHLAFNDPHVARFEDPYPVKMVKLDAVCRQQQVAQGQFPSVDAMPQYALTLTIPTLLSARHILCLASGPHKAAIVRAMLLGPIDPQCPASILRQTPQANLLLDKQAASLL